MGQKSTSILNHVIKPHVNLQEGYVFLKDNLSTAKKKKIMCKFWGSPSRTWKRLFQSCWEIRDMTGHECQSRLHIEVEIRLLTGLFSIYAKCYLQIIIIYVSIEVVL